MRKNYLLKFLTVAFLSFSLLVCDAQNWMYLQTKSDTNIQNYELTALSPAFSADGKIIIVGNPANINYSALWYPQTGSIRRHVWSDEFINSLDGGYSSQPTFFGENDDDRFGHSVSVSADGETVAVGVSPITGGSTSHAEIYGWNEDGWMQLGSDLYLEGITVGGAKLDVSISSNGEIVAVGSPYSNENGNYSGSVRIYSWDGEDWIQLGNGLFGAQAGDQFGDDVSISSNGEIVAVGSPYSDENGNSSGSIRFYGWDGEDWIQLGSNLLGAQEGGHFGEAVSISSNGEIVAVGSPYSDENGNNSGSVRIYSWDGEDWVQLGNDLFGQEGNEKFGYSLSISGDGEIVAIGAPGNTASGAARIYTWNGDDWVQMGDDLTSEGYGAFGTSISLSKNGQRLAVTSLSSPVFGEAGATRIYASPLGCLDSLACNYNPLASQDDDSCQFLDACGVCGGTAAVSGCTLPEACNYNPMADCDDGSCTQLDACGVCGGPGAIYECGCSDIPDGDCGCFDNVLDECGICGGPGAIYECGCSDIPDGDCDCDGNILDALGICGGTCVSDADNDGICDNEDPCIGVIDECGVCNGPGATYQCGCSDIPEGDCDCDGTPLSPVVLECNCDEAITNQVEETITNFDDCTITETCYCECINDADQDGVCDELEWAGCKDQSACNYSPNATDEDNGLCIYPGNDCDDLNPLTFLDYVNEDCFCGGFEVTGIDESSTTSISVYPNPCSSSFTINTDGKPQYSNYRIYDMTGKEVHSGFVGSGITNIEINTLASGIYSLVILSKDGDTFRQSLVVQREE